VALAGKDFRTVKEFHAVQRRHGAPVPARRVWISRGVDGGRARLFEYEPDPGSTGTYRTLSTRLPPRQGERRV